MDERYERICATRPGVVTADVWLEPYEDAVRWRRKRFYDTLARLEGRHGRLADFANAHLHYGLHETPDAWVYREWAPAAQALHLIGDFNGWDRTAHPLVRKANGTWEITLPKPRATLAHGQRYKVHVVTRRGAEDRIPLFARRVVQDEATPDFSAQVWCPPEPFRWTDQSFAIDPRKPRLIYEAHPGMAQEKEGVGTWREFAETVLPRAKAGGYDTVQLMAVMEHPYYGSFGYHVTNFFAPSSRFGTPEDLKALIDRAHAMGLAVLLDVVHSHAAKNVREGLNEFDGTPYQFFHEGPRGDHPLWDSKLFDYGKHDVQNFLLSNLKYWLDEFHFDGFRFDGVTSMMYLHHGVGTGFDHYDKYFRQGVDVDGVTYLQLANHLVRQVRPDALTIAEDVSGMPGIAAPVAEGGLGFDFRLAMGLPDYWIQQAQARDEDWSMGGMLHALTNRRPSERHVAYVESHDQCLVGDKTMIFRLIDKEMYWHMGVDDPDLEVARGVAMHKMIRLATIAAGGEAWLGFMGNEFGHPEWVDFPREGNGWSYKHARRQWSLADDPKLKYHLIGAFDRAMLALVKERGVLGGGAVRGVMTDEERKVLAFERGGLLFAFNWHPTASYTDLPLGVGGEGAWRVALCSDDAAFGGFARVDESVTHAVADGAVKVYLPARTAVVYENWSLSLV